MTNPSIIEWGKVSPAEPFNFYLHSEPGGKGRRKEFSLPNLASPTLPWDLIPLATIALSATIDSESKRQALNVLHAFLGRQRPELVEAIVATGDNATEVLGYILERWVEHSQVDPKA